jgi:hypothetical protein
MLKVYCDTGAYRKELSALERKGVICVYQFKYENKNRKITHRAAPSRPSWKEVNCTWTELSGLSWNDMGKQSNLWEEIRALLGKKNTLDAKHLDSAYMEGCHVFLTSDKDDIVARRREIEQLLGIRIFHYQDDWDAFLQLLSIDI